MGCRRVIRDRPRGGGWETTPCCITTTQRVSKWHVREYEVTRECNPGEGNGRWWVRALTSPKTEQFRVAVAESHCISRKGIQCEGFEMF
jgi:hypothetical protein